MGFTTAEKVLIVGGTLSLAFSFVIGFILSRARLKDPSADHAWLLQAHRVALWEGFMLLGLVFAVALSSLSPGQYRSTESAGVFWAPPPGSRLRRKPPSFHSQQSPLSEIG